MKVRAKIRFRDIKGDKIREQGETFTVIIDKVDNLTKDVEIQRMEKKWDKLYEQTHPESVVDSIQPQPVALVSEKKYEYGADAFEAYMNENKGNVSLEMVVLLTYLESLLGLL